MLKFFTLIGFFLIYFSGHAQKAFYFQDKDVDLNKFSYFYLANSPMDAHELVDPFLDKNKLDANKYMFFALYNEASLKNLTIIDGSSEFLTLIFNLYEASSFDQSTFLPMSYKPKKIKGNFLILDILNGANKTLVWRGWIDLKKIKATEVYTLYQKAIHQIFLNFTIEPTVIE
jgi:hypothetical protein